MSRWLLKTEPDEYSYDRLVEEKRARWDGVRNNTALIHLRNMHKGDQAFIYHTGKERCIVAIAEIVKGPYPDPDADDEKLVVVDLKPVKRLKRAIPLSEIKNDKRFADFPLVRISRLSVMQVTAEQWSQLNEMAE